MPTHNVSYKEKQCQVFLYNNSFKFPTGKATVFVLQKILSYLRVSRPSNVCMRI